MKLKEIKKMFPGDWKYNMGSNVYVLYGLDKDQDFNRIVYWRDRDAWTLGDYDVSATSINTVIVFYKKHFKMKNFQ